MIGKQTITIAGKEVPAYFFGTSRLSKGLNPFTVHPDDITVEELLVTKGVYLNPFKQKNKMEIFCLSGTLDDFQKWYKEALESYCVQEACERCPDIDIWDSDLSPEQWKKFKEVKNQIAMEFTPWWNK